MKSANTAVLAITQTFTAHSGRNTTRRRGSIFSQRGGSERLKDERQPPGRLFFLLAAKERTKENCRCFDAADPRLGGCTPPRPPKRKSEGAGAKRKQYYFSFLTPPPLPPPLSRVFPRTPAGGRGRPPCQRVTPHSVGRCRGATEGSGPEGLSPLGDWGIPTGLASPSIPWQPPPTAKGGGLPPSLAPLVRNPFTAVRRGRACPARHLAITAHVSFAS